MEYKTGLALARNLIIWLDSHGKDLEHPCLLDDLSDLVTELEEIKKEGES